PGTRPLYVHALNFTPGTISISLSAATSSYSRSVRPSASRLLLPQSKSRIRRLGSNPLTAGSTVVRPSAKPTCVEPLRSCPGGVAAAAARSAAARPSSFAAAPDPRIATAPASAFRRENDGCPAVLLDTVRLRSHSHLRAA